MAHVAQCLAHKLYAWSVPRLDSLRVQPGAGVVGATVVLCTR